MAVARRCGGKVVEMSVWAAGPEKDRWRLWPCAAAPKLRRPMPRTQMSRLIALAPLLLVLSGCTQFPEIDARVPEAERHGPPPPLVDVVPLLARADAAQASPRLTEASGTATRLGAGEM